MWQEVDTAKYKVLSLYLAGENDKNHVTIQSEQLLSGPIFEHGTT
jgi:hypothetical protein